MIVVFLVKRFGDYINNSGVYYAAMSNCLHLRACKIKAIVETVTNEEEIFDIVNKYSDDTIHFVIEGIWATPQTIFKLVDNNNVTVTVRLHSKWSFMDRKTVDYISLLAATSLVCDPLPEGSAWYKGDNWDFVKQEFRDQSEYPYKNSDDSRIFIAFNEFIGLIHFYSN